MWLYMTTVDSRINVAVCVVFDNCNNEQFNQGQYFPEVLVVMIIRLCG
jgi:hypothetical protein